MTTEFRYFHYSVPKLAEDMNQEELERECECAESYIQRCEEIGQGVNCKESIRYRDCRIQLLARFNVFRYEV